MAGPLSHIRVLDLGRIMAAPWATQILADLGADVIKIERPGVGDDTRSWGPPFLADAEGKPTREAGYFLAVNRGKRSVTLDIAKPEGQALVRQLAEGCDVVVENFKAGALAKYGLDATSLRTLKPALIYCSVTGFGQDGPRRDQAAYDFMIQAMGGLMSLTGERDGAPQKVGLPIVDLMTGMYAAVAILAAVAKRERTGEGETIDLAMLDVQAGFLANQAMNWLVGGKVPHRAGNRHPNIQPQDVFPAQDGHIVLAVGNDGQFAKLCEAIGRPDWTSDARFARNADRVRNEAELSPLLAARFQDFTRAELTALLDAAGVPCGPINTVPDVFADPQVRHREMLRHLPHPLAGSVPQVVSPIRLQESPLAFDRAPPTLGQHTREVLDELGISAEQRMVLAEKGVV
ncbi:MAG TPA: CaiB/BaiF CoA-transferase family protein [Falsiroseomonas sp.]|jgi:crotonobetainyl-CoA:carnitine CoA-transferase CaiB-like acyl-CoA transferase|nr:CaiB/BaiF CoA-transferase family protein [Falsiroseomonas sp.]